MRKYIVIAILMAAVGTGIAVRFIPSEDEIATLSAQRPSTQGAVAMPAEEAEAAYAKGERSWAVVGVVVDSRITGGQHKEATAILEAYSKANPADLNAHRKLAELYQLAGDNAKYIAELNLIAQAEPTEANLKALADVYNAGRRYDEQIATLTKLVEVTQRAKPQYIVDLATILMVQNRLDEALVLVQEVKTRFPDYRSFALTRIEMSTLAAQGKGDDAYALALHWSQASIATTPDAAADPKTNRPAVVGPNLDELADLANILNYGGFPGHAVKLLEPYSEKVATHGTLAVAYVNAHINAGSSDRAYTVLTEAYNAGRMEPVLYGTYIDLTLQRADTEAAGIIVGNLQPEIFSQEQALELIALPRLTAYPELLATLVKRFDVPVYLEGKPVLAAVVAMQAGAADQDEKTAVALKSDLSTPLRVALIKACHRAGKEPCVDEALKAFPALPTLSRASADEYAELHIAIGRAGAIVDAFGEQVGAGKKDFEPAHLRLSAAAGRIEPVEAWLVAQGNTASIKDLERLYYVAADHGQPATAGRVALKLYERDPSPMHREMVVASYLRAGQYAEALPLVRENLGKTENAQAQYIEVLNKLARNDAQARKELVEYAEAQLQSGAEEADQIAAAYILINHGERARALPYIRSNAESRGGEWATMWKQLNPPKSKAVAAKPLTPEQMRRVGSDPKASEATRRQMAFGLINAGDKASAAGIFQQLSEGRGPHDQNVKDLLYLWSPDLSQTQMDWLVGRAKSAATGSERAGWSDHIQTYGTDANVVQYVSSTPEALYHQELRRRYFRALAGYGSREAYEGQMKDWVAGTTDLAALRDYADTAQAYGYRKGESDAYQRILALEPNDEQALKALAVTTFGKAHYSATAHYLDAYAKARATKEKPETNPQEAYFYRALLARRDGRTDDARADFRQVVQASGDAPGDLPVDAQSRLYTALFHLGEQAKAQQGFRSLLERNPGNKAVLADYMSLLIEYKKLDEATAIANQYDRRSEAAPASRAEGEQPASEQHSNAQYVLTITYVSQVTVEPTAPLSPQEQIAREEQLRLQLLYARIEMENGQPEAAARRLEILKLHYPNNPQLLTFAANLRTQDGYTYEAADMLKQAQKLSPENEDIPRVLQNIQEINRSSPTNYLKADYQYRGVGSNNEHIGTLSGAARVTDRVEAGFNVRRDMMDLKQLRRSSDGLPRDWQPHQQQGELYMAYLGDRRARTQVSLFHNEDTPGAGLYYDADNAYGRSGVFAEYHRPYWDFAEAVLNEATRDRVGARHYMNITPSLSFGGEASLNRYNVNASEDVAQSALFRASFIQRLQEKTADQPYLAIGYGFDGEYLLDEPETRPTLFGFNNTIVFGQDYKLLPIVSREVHFLSAIYENDWTPTTHARLVGGWAFDRLGENGPQVEGQVTQDLSDRMEAGVRGSYGLQSSSSFNDNSAAMGGAHLMYKF